MVGKEILLPDKVLMGHLLTSSDFSVSHRPEIIHTAGLGVGGVMIRIICRKFFNGTKYTQKYI